MYLLIVPILTFVYHRSHFAYTQSLPEANAHVRQQFKRQSASNTRMEVTTSLYTPGTAKLTRTNSCVLEARSLDVGRRREGGIRLHGPTGVSVSLKQVAERQIKLELTW